jgi:valyl-tRNA synthetase
MKLSKAYEPGEYEKDIYDLWEQSGAFKPTPGGEPFITIMPPPNANANLHIGHALNNGLQDIATRYQRMQGKSTLFLPGADHAGFETQVVYEKQLTKEGKSRFDFSREELYAQIYEFVQNNRGNVENQIRAMGASVDWSRKMFTLDPQVIKTAYATFKKLWDDRLIYRGERLVNYCTFHRTAFADIEVLHREEKGHLWYIRYPLSTHDGEVVVATTRPETMLGDTAVAVNPHDKRYKQFIGKTVRLPLTGREVPIIADEFVDEAFGTGAVKITPAHDQNDYEAAERHALPLIRIIDHEGKITAEAPTAYRGLTIKEARKQVLADLEAGHFLARTEDYQHSVGHCYKCDTVIEPMLMEQWFIDMPKLAAPAIKVLGSGDITFYPSSKREQVINYLEGVRDWNISRQIAWGIPIPAFCNAEDSDDWIFDERVDQETIEVNGHTYHRDPDVFDTWFSSGQWPFVTTDFPDGADFKRFYPNSLMETGVDIMYQWVARMICLGLYVTGEIPFKDVYLHGMVRGEDGRKMSKSLGNVIDPNELIASFGSDALRMGMVAGRSAGENAAYAPGKIQAARNFCNKLWNVARYVEDVIGDAHKARRAPELVTIADHWMLSKLQQSTEKISQDLDNYRFSEAYDTLYHTVWDDFADWYLEASKATPNHGLLAYGLEVLLKLAHPFAPFVTETIWQTLKWESSKSVNSLLISAAWPDIRLEADKSMAQDFEAAMTIVSECRTIMANVGLTKPVLSFTDSPFLEEHGGLISTLARLYGVEKGNAADAGTSGLRLTSVPFAAWIEVDKKTALKYLTKLEENQTAAAESVERLKARLSHKSYVQNAPEKLVAETKAQLEAAEAKVSQITAEIDSFQSMTQGI